MSYGNDPGLAVAAGAGMCCWGCANILPPVSRETKIAILASILLAAGVALWVAGNLKSIKQMELTGQVLTGVVLGSALLVGG